EVKGIMYAAAQIAGMLAELGEPLLPFTAEKLFKMLNISPLNWNELEEIEEILPEGHQLNASELIFSKIEDETIDFQINKLNQSKTQNKMTNPNAEPQRESINFQDFQKIDMRLRAIFESKKVEKVDKLLELLLDTGIDI